MAKAHKKNSGFLLRELKRISMLVIGVGLLVVAIESYSYLTRICNCPAEIVGRPVVPCCVDSPVVFRIWIGIAITIIGIASFVYLHHKLKVNGK